MNKVTQIIWGVGKAVLADFTDASKLIALANMQDLSVSSTFSEEDIKGGNKAYPIATFPTDKEITISVTNSDFDTSMIEYSDGATHTLKTSGQPNMTHFMEFLVPTNGTVTLPHTPVADSVNVIGFTLGTATPAVGSYYVTGTTLSFNTGDAGKLAKVVYKYTPTTDVDLYEMFETSVAKPFSFTYLFPVYDNNNEIVANGQLVIYKAKMTSGANFEWSHRTASAPKFEAKALDPQRPDKKLWDISYEEVE